LLSKNVGPVHWWQITKGTFKKEMLFFYRYKGWLISSIIQPIIWILLFGYLGKGFGIKETSAGVDFTSYMILGVVSLMLISQTMWGSGNALRTEQYRGTLESIMTAPSNIISILIGFSFVDLVQSAYMMGVSVSFGLLIFGFVGNLVDFVALIVVMGMIIFSLFGFGLLFAGITLMIKQSGALINLIQPIIFLLSGMFFPVSALPEPVRTIGLSLPITQGLMALQDVVLRGATLTDVGFQIFYLFASGVVLGLFGYYVLRRLMQKARKLGLYGTF